MADPLPRDQNRVTAAGFVASSDGVTVVPGQIDQNTGRILVDATSGVVPPVSSTDNAVARFDGTTGSTIQNSVVIVGDTGAVTGITTLVATGLITGSGFKAGSSAGVSGTFTTVDLKTVTVVNGIITSIA